MSLAVGVRAFSFTRLLFRTTTFDKIPTIVKLISRGAFFFSPEKGDNKDAFELRVGAFVFSIDRSIDRGSQWLSRQWFF